ncbi:SNF2-related protein [Streptomyces sp. NPDC003023]|uniref:SNF2-related protein n=1 Tax=Streptomyces sp. NPDC003023 TaxID=3364675 RepID=UPI00369EEDBE
MPDAVPGTSQEPALAAPAPAPGAPAGQASPEASGPATADGPPPAGTVIEVRDEEWVVRSTTEARPGEHVVEATGASELVRGQEARFLVPTLDRPRILRPEHTTLVPDASPGFRRGRLFLEAVLRKTPLPQIERRLALTDGFLLDRMDYQLRPAVKALNNPLRPRLLVGDVVGLGKTLEIGFLLGELIRRGRGERILVVTPAPVLEQFQHEMWTRFSLPLVRLDSAGIARIERKIPAGRNPFTFYKRVIISMDTLKNKGRYRPWLEKIHWDAVVIDESHNVINRGSQRRELAELLADRCDALILASATPHNGVMRDFTGLVRLLDPMAVKDPDDPKADELRPLMVRRTKRSAEVVEQLGDRRWAPRGETRPVACPAGDLEEQVFAELAAHWLAAPADTASASADSAPADATLGGRAARAARTGDERLFPYVLLKSFLSSHRALFATAAGRLAQLGHKLPKGDDKVTDAPRPADPAAAPADVASLLRLVNLARAVERESTAPGGATATAKLSALVAELRAIGVGAGNVPRAVVFSERRETLNWLGEVLPPLLGWKRPEDAQAAVKVMHSDASSDKVQMEYVDEFARAGGAVRVLLTGDGASEGVNLHRQCHHLVHWDVPWSLIRVEQRNGRIDRYGQSEPPEFRALLMTSGVEGALDDTAVAQKVLAREEKVHLALGAVEAAAKESDGDREEVRVMEALFLGATGSDAVADLEVPGAAEGGELPVPQLLNAEFGAGPVDFAAGSEAGLDLDLDLDLGLDDDLFAPDDDTASSASAGTAPVHDGPDALPPIPVVDELRLFPDRREYVLTGLEELQSLEAFRLETLLEGDDLSFATPSDLADRLDVLPAGYLRDHGITRRMNLTFSRENADESLKRAREDVHSLSLWPDAHYVGELHPVVEWITDKVLVRIGRQQALVLQVDREQVPEPVFLTQGVWSNAEGRPTVVAWLAVDGLGDGRTPRARHLVRTADAGDPTQVDLAALGLGPGMDDHFAAGDPALLQPLVPAAVAETRRAMDGLRRKAAREVDAPLLAYEREVGDWRQETLPGFTSAAKDATAEALSRVAERMRTAGDEPMIRVLAVLEPAG